MSLPMTVTLRVQGLSVEDALARAEILARDRECCPWVPDDWGALQTLHVEQITEGHL